MNTTLGILFGLIGIVLLAGAAVVALPLLRGRQGAAAAPPPPNLPGGDDVLHSTAAERQRRLDEALQRRRGGPADSLPDFSETPELPAHRADDDTIGTARPISYSGAPGEAVPGGQRYSLSGEVLPAGAERPAVERRMADPAFDNTEWLGLQEQMVVPPRRGRLMTIAAIVVGTALLVALLAFIFWLINASGAARPPAAGTTVLTVADFGEGAEVRESAAGKRLADTLRIELRNSIQGHPELVIRTAGRVTNPAEAEREMRGSHAVIWGALPGGESGGTLSATLQLRTTLAGAPWEQVGPAGRLLLPSTIMLPEQSRVMQGNLSPLLLAVLYYQSGNFESARNTAQALTASDNAAIRGTAGFLYANTLTAQDDPAQAVEIYSRLDAGGWSVPAVLNNWGVAAEVLGQADVARGAYDRALAAAPAPGPADTARILTNRGRANLYLAQDLNAARADFSRPWRPMRNSGKPPASWASWPTRRPTWRTPASTPSRPSAPTPPTRPACGSWAWWCCWKATPTRP